MNLSAVLDGLRAGLYYASFIGRILAFPFRLAYVPISYLLSALRVVFAPAIYLFSYITGWCRGVIDFIASLQVCFLFSRKSKMAQLYYAQSGLHHFDVLVRVDTNIIFLPM